MSVEIVIEVQVAILCRLPEDIDFSSEFFHSLAQELVISFQLSLLGALPNSFEVGGYFAFEVMLSASITVCPRLLDYITFQLS